MYLGVDIDENILLAGKAGSGKDLLGSYMKTKYDFKGEVLYSSYNDTSI